MKVIHEDIDNLERYIGNKRVDIHAELPLIMADAYSDSKNRQEAIDKLLKGDKKEPDIETTNNKVLGAKKQPVPKMPEMAKVNLEESLFEDYDDYGDFFAPDIRDAMSNLKGAFAQVAYIVSSADFDFDDAFADGYPFDKSFDELSLEVASWVDDFNNSFIKDESLTEARGKKAAPFVDSHGNSYSDEDRSTADIDDSSKNMWTKVYNEITPEHYNWIKRSKFKNVPATDRYDMYQVDVTYDDNLDIIVNSEDELDFAKKVADAYGLELRPAKPYRKGDSRLVATLVMPKA